MADRMNDSTDARIERAKDSALGKHDSHPSHLDEAGEDEPELDRHRFLAPECAVVVEDGDAFFGGNVIRGSFVAHPAHEVDDRRLRGSVGPRREFGHAHPPHVDRNLSSSSTAFLPDSPVAYSGMLNPLLGLSWP